MTDTKVGADKFVCSLCIGAEAFSEWISERGATGNCYFKEEHQSEKVVSLGELAEHVHDFYSGNYLVGEEYSIPPFDDEDSFEREQVGMYWEEIITELVDAEDSVHELLIKILPSLESTGQKPGEPSEDSMYEDCTRYESVLDRQARHENEYNEWLESTTDFRWSQFCWQVKHQNRMYKLEKTLNRLFENTPASVIYTLPIGTVIHRARKYEPYFAKKPPAEYLWAPPCEKASAGRMNHAYVPIFYGAFSEDCALAEVQPYIGQRVSIGQFIVKKEIQVFDFTVFDGITEVKPTSNVSASTRYSVVRHIQELISQPVAPEDRPLEYLPTQFLTEYIREHFEVEAIIFFSSLRPNDPENRNIAIFLENGQSFTESKTDELLAFSGVEPSTRQIEAIHYTTSSFDHRSLTQ